MIAEPRVEREAGVIVRALVGVRAEIAFHGSEREVARGREAGIIVAAARGSWEVY